MNLVAKIEPLHVGDALAEEMAERGWNSADVAARMGPPGEFGVNLLKVELVLAVRDPKLLLGDEMPMQLAAAFDVHPDLFRNLDAAWRRANGHPGGAS